jgi:hypothetical protein
MSYLSLVKSLPEFLRQPTGIATVASIGLHGVLWVMLPILPLASKTTEAEVQKPVQLVQLTPAEINRLPNFATPQISLPPLPKSNNLYPPLPPLQSSNSLPSLGSPFPSNSPLFAPPPSISFAPSTALPPPMMFPPPTTRIEIPDNPAPPRQNSRPTISFQPQPGLDELQRNSQLTVDPNELPDLQAANPSADDLLPQATPPSEPNTPAPDSETVESEAQPSETPTTPATTTPQPNQTPAPIEQAAAPAVPTDRAAKIPEEAIAQLRAAQERYRELYTYNPSGTTAEEVTSNIETWSQQALEAAGKEWKPLEITPTYPEAACPRKLKGNAVFGVLADAEGKIVDAPVLVQSTGYNLLNAQAKNDVAAYKFPATGEQQPYLVTLPFTYSSDACANAPVEPAPVS